MIDSHAKDKLSDWIRKSEIAADMVLAHEVIWTNPNVVSYGSCIQPPLITEAEILEAEARLQRFGPYLAKAFPETQVTHGIIESPLRCIPQMKAFLEQRHGFPFPGGLWLKCDSHLPISGSIKARGGIYEVLKHAEDLVLKSGQLAPEDNYAVLNSPRFKSFFGDYSIAVGSTGNLGLSIGIIGAKLGFRVTVHMSADAKSWKKELLRSKGVRVIEYASDYSKAVEQGRAQAIQDVACHFVDDENSRELFLGYAVAAYRLQKQLKELRIKIDEEHPLFVYLPCGVGGGPGGVAFGLKQVFKDNVHCFFAEPTHSPCMLLGLATGLHDQVSVGDIGLDNKTEADGLAVGRPSGFVGKIMDAALGGIYTVQDKELFVLLKALDQTENIQLEPSALAGMPGPMRLVQSGEGQRYLTDWHLNDLMPQAVHIVWATGGSLVPKEVMAEYLQREHNATG